MTEGFILNTRDFLRPLETEEGYGNDVLEVPPTVKAVIQAEGVLPGGVAGAYAVSHVPDAAASVKASVSARGFPILSEAKSEPDYGSRSTTTSYGSLAGGASYTLWEEKDTVSRDLSIKVEPKASCNDQRPNTPRSKHSATEQKRRCKINDRFHILRGIIPHSDQKRDKASFLLEVIEYIRFLQEKVQKYESSNPECGQDEIAVKLMPWKLSLQKNSSHAPANGLSVSHVVSDDSSAPAHIYSKKVNESNIPSVALPTPISSTHNQPQTCVVSGGISYKKMMDADNLAPTHNLLFPLERETNTTRLQPKSLEAHNNASRDQCGWLRSCGLADGAVIRQRLNEKEKLIIDEGTINVSTAYSHELLNTLIQTLQSSGIDLSQANISMQIDLGKRAVNKRPDTTTCTNKDKEDSVSCNQAKGCSRSRPIVEEPSESSKRLKTHG
ncbi:transcription factor BIM2-like isoform X2 [Curcuma longa]|uniref:transcription factor BIM2-like isoform X2 n=1 Tax=Curcuma longa TaxID=136217 RepID=UPI003D9F183C